MKNLIFAYISAIPFVAATIEPHDIGYLAFTAILSVVLMALGKLADFAIKFYLIRYTDRTRGEGLTDKNNQLQITEMQAFGNELFRIKAAGDWVESARKRPVPRMVFDRFWLEGELAILFAAAGKGKSVLGVQLAEAIARGQEMEGFRMKLPAQIALRGRQASACKSQQVTASLNHQADLSTSKTDAHKPASPWLSLLINSYTFRVKFGYGTSARPFRKSLLPLRQL